MSRASRTSSCVTTRQTALLRRRSIAWLSSVYLKTLRDFRDAILYWGIEMALVAVPPLESMTTSVTTPQVRKLLISPAASFAWNADTVAVDTIGGYATF